MRPQKPIPLFEAAERRARIVAAMADYAERVQPDFAEICDLTVKARVQMAQMKVLVRSLRLPVLIEAAKETARGG